MTNKKTEQEILDGFATELWHMTAKIGAHMTNQHPIWLTGESERRRKALMDVRCTLDGARALLMGITRDAFYCEHCKKWHSEAVAEEICKEVKK